MKSGCRPSILSPGTWLQSTTLRIFSFFIMRFITAVVITRFRSSSSRLSSSFSECMYWFTMSSCGSANRYSSCTSSSRDRMNLTMKFWIPRYSSQLMCSILRGGSSTRGGLTGRAWQSPRNQSRGTSSRSMRTMLSLSSLLASCTQSFLTHTSLFNFAMASLSRIRLSSCRTVTMQEASFGRCSLRSCRYFSRMSTALSLRKRGSRPLAQRRYRWTMGLEQRPAEWSTPQCLPRMYSAMTRSSSSLQWSVTTKNRSNRDMMGSVMLRLARRLFALSYRPNLGFAAARIEVRVLRVAFTPAFASEIVCCSMASWIEVMSLGLILSNQSMQQTPLSASTRAPAWIAQSPLMSLVTEAVRPALLEVLPFEQILLGMNSAVILRNWDFAVEGSPTTRMLRSPRSRSFWSVSLCTPEKSCRMMAFFISWCPKMSGKRELANFLQRSGSSAICRIISLSAGLNRSSAFFMYLAWSKLYFKSGLSSSIASTLCITLFLGQIELATKINLQLKSRMPRPRNPLTPPLYTSLRLPICSFTACAFSPGRRMQYTCGAAQRYPVTITLSPGLARSTKESLRIISMLLGMPPGGISLGSYCTFIRCKSLNSLRLSMSFQLSLLSQDYLTHRLGVEYRNYCTIGLDSSPQQLHLKTPFLTSGCTSVARVTIPLKVISLPSSWHLRMRRFQKLLLNSSNLTGSSGSALLTTFTKVWQALCSSGSSFWKCRMSFSANQSSWLTMSLRLTSKTALS